MNGREDWYGLKPRLYFSTYMYINVNGSLLPRPWFKIFYVRKLLKLTICHSVLQGKVVYYMKFIDFFIFKNALKFLENTDYWIIFLSSVRSCMKVAIK
jgi:hypothetical protein